MPDKELASILQAINDAGALKQIVLGLEEQISNINSRIVANEKEIARLNGLILLTDNLKKEMESLTAKLKENQSELDNRLAKLDKAGFKVPLNDSKAVKGFMSL